MRDIGRARENERHRNKETDRHTQREEARDAKREKQSNRAGTPPNRAKFVRGSSFIHTPHTHTHTHS